MSKHQQLNNNGSDNKPVLDINDIEMVFGNPNAPKSGMKPEIHVTNELTHGTDYTRTTNKNVGPSELEAHSSQPLLEPDREPPKPPLAGAEIDDLDVVDDHPKIPYPGIDDGLLEPKDNQQKEEDVKKEVQNDANKSKPTKVYADVKPGKWWASNDQPDGIDSANALQPRYGEDDGEGAGDGDTSNSKSVIVVPDVNMYQQSKNLAHGMMDLALLSANANQLSNVMAASSHPYFLVSITFISLSIILQIAVGVSLIMNSNCDVTDKKQICKAVKVNNYTVAGVFLVTIINVFITSFAVTPNLPTPTVVAASP